MFDNNNDNRGRNIGLVLLGATAAVAGVALYLYYDDSARERIQGMVNREKAKYYVKHTLNAPDALVDAVDSLSDKEVNALANLADKAQTAGNKTSDAFDEIVRRTKEVGNNVSDFVSDHF